MAGSVNKVILIGNLGRDPELRSTQDGTRIANLAVATSESWRDRVSGERKERTEWHRVVIFNERLAEIAEKYLKKGAKVYIEGALQTRKWTDQGGQERYSTEIVLQRFRGELTMLDGAGGRGGGAGGPPMDGDFDDGYADAPSAQRSAPGAAGRARRPQARQRPRRRHPVLRKSYHSIVITGLDGVDGPLTASLCQSWPSQQANGREPSMTEVTTIGLDLAKNVFQVHGVDAAGRVVVRRALRRGQVLRYFANLPASLVGMEACATAHYWGRELARLGHRVRLITPAYAKAYVRRNKNDAADAAAICEAVSRPSMRFVALKSEAQQAAAGLHKVRELLVKQRTMLINALRGLMAEFGIIAQKGPPHVDELKGVLSDPEDARIPEPLHAGLEQPGAQPRAPARRRSSILDKQIVRWGRDNPTCRHLNTIPGYGPILASAMAASRSIPAPFTAAAILPPRSAWHRARTAPAARSSSARSPSAATAICAGSWSTVRWRCCAASAAKRIAGCKRLLAEKKRLVVACALANKMARIGWAVMLRQEDFRAAPATA